jgi:hypothetical protein
VAHQRGRPHPASFAGRKVAAINALADGYGRRVAAAAMRRKVEV